MLGNNGCRPVAKRYGATPVILLAVIRSRSSAGAKWFVQKVAGVLVRPRRIQSFSVLIVRSTLPVGLTITNGDVVMDDTKTFAQLCKAARKLSAIVGPDVARFAPMGNQVIVEELGGPPTV